MNKKERRWEALLYRRVPAHKNRKEDKICKPLFCYNPQFDTHIDDQFMPLTDDSLITKAKIAFMAKTLGNATFHCPCWDSLRMGYSTAVHNVSHVVVCFPWTTWTWISTPDQSVMSIPLQNNWPELFKGFCGIKNRYHRGKGNFTRFKETKEGGVMAKSKV